MGFPESILHVHTVPVISGSGINTLLTMQGSVARGHRVGLATQSEGRLTEAARASGIEVYTVPSLGREVRPASDLRSVLDLKALVRTQEFTIIHSHNSKAGFVGRLAGRMARTPLVVHTVHGFAFHDAETRLRQWTFRQLERRAARWTDGFIYISQPLIDWADRERIGKGIPRVLIYSGIDIDAYGKADRTTYRSAWGVGDDRVVVGLVSKLWEGKGHAILLDAWQRVVRTTDRPPLLVIVGEGPLEAALKNQVSVLGIEDTVRFTGFLEDTAEVTAALDIAVLPSLFEGMGRVVLEALAAGRPVVASDVGGIPDLVRHGWNGLLVPPGDTNALADTLGSLIHDSRSRIELANRAAGSLSAEHSASGMVDAIHAFYDRLRARV